MQVGTLTVRCADRAMPLMAVASGAASKAVTVHGPVHASVTVLLSVPVFPTVQAP